MTFFEPFMDSEVQGFREKVTTRENLPQRTPQYHLPELQGKQREQNRLKNFDLCGYMLDCATHGEKGIITKARNTENTKRISVT
jgi:hypothetical protein